MPGNEVVIDSNVAVSLAVPVSPFHERAVRFVADCGSSRLAMIAPPVFEGEVDSAIRRYAFHKILSPTAAQASYDIIDSLPIEIVFEREIRMRSRMIAVECSQTTVYDSLYAALCLLRTCDFWTADRKFVQAAAQRYPSIKFLGDY